MTSTFLNYRIYSADLGRSLQRVAGEPTNASDQKYYEANIGKVKSVDDFLGNYRLFTYAMKAYGLSDLGNAKALMKQVLESNLSDPNSVANRLNDSRYKAFAKAFNFATDGTIKSTGQMQTNAQRQDMLIRMNVTTASDASSLDSQFSAVTSVDALESNDGLYNRVLIAYGLSAAKTSKADVARAFESDLSDPTSFANRPDFGSSTTYAKLRTLAEDFNFAKDGSIGSQKMLMSAQNIATTQTAYMALARADAKAKAAPDAASQAAADTKAQAAANDANAYFAKKMPQLTSVDQIMADPKLVSYLRTTFSLDPIMSNTQIRNVLTSNLLDPKSVANTYGIDPKKPPTTATNYQLLASAFSIGTDGTADDHSLVQTPANLSAATAAYTKAAAAAVVGTDKKTVDDAAKAAQTETDYFTITAPTMKSVSQLLSDSRLVAYIRTAFGLPAPVTDASGKTTTAGTSTADLTKILTSNLLDPSSAANTTGDKARKLATSFNFAPDGLVYSQRSIQTAANVSATTSAYQLALGTSGSAKATAQAQTETDYYTTTLTRVKSVDDLLSNTRIVAYLSKAYNIPATQTSVLRQVMTSDLLDPKSKANTLGGGYQRLAAAFDVSSDGTIAHAADKEVQTKTGVASIHTAFLNQTMETEAGDNQGDGVRLALYFKRVAPTITNVYGILADKALTSVVQTMLGLSSTSSKADIDSQARFLKSKINIADFQDPKKLDKLVSRFAALYDTTNNTNSDPTLQLFGASSS